MPARPRKPTAPVPLVWERAEPAARAAPGPLSRERIVRAAIAIADKEGLEAVSLRRVAAKLNVGPMRLYSYTATKEGLLELMADAVFAEVATSGPKRGDWKTALRSMAHRTRRATKEHPWFVELLGGRLHLGPNALAHLEASLGALAAAPGFEDIDDVIHAAGAVNAYVVGAIRNETSELHAERESGMNKRTWQLATWPYLERLLATGRFPTIARVVAHAAHPPAEVGFDWGLEAVIEGIAARLGGRHHRGARPR